MNSGRPNVLVRGRFVRLTAAALVLLCSLVASPAISQDYTVGPVPGLASVGVGTYQVSGDSKKIVFSSTQDPLGLNPDHDWEVFVFDTTTQQLLQITSSEGNACDRRPQTSWDGSRIVFRTCVGDRFYLYSALVGYATTAPTASFRQISEDVGDVPFVLSMDGRIVAFVSARSLVNFQNPYETLNTEKKVQLFRVTIDPSPCTSQLTTFENGIADAAHQVEIDIDYSGNRILFTSSRDLISGQNTELNQEIFALIDSEPLQVTSTERAVINKRPRMARIEERFAYLSNSNRTGENADRNFEVFWQFGFPRNAQELSSAAGEQLTLTRGSMVDDVGIDGSGNRVVFSSTGDHTGHNPDRNREVFLIRLSWAGSLQLGFTQVTRTGPVETSVPGGGSIQPLPVFNVLPSIDTDARVVAFKQFVSLSTDASKDGLLTAAKRSEAAAYPPTIYCIDPARGGPGTSVRVVGNHFLQTTAVRFGALEARSYHVVDANDILAVAPPGVEQGRISVTTPQGTATSAEAFAPAELRVTGTEFNQGMGSYPGVAGKDTIVRVFTETNADDGWSIDFANLTLKTPSGQIWNVAPRMYDRRITNPAPDHSSRANINFFVPGSKLAEAGTYTFTVRAITAGEMVVSESFTKSLTRTPDIVMLIQGILHNPDSAEWELILESLDQLSRIYPVRTGIDSTSALDDSSSTAGLRIGWIPTPLWAEHEGATEIPACRAIYDMASAVYPFADPQEIEEMFEGVPICSGVMYLDLFAQLLYQNVAISSGGFPIEFIAGFMMPDEAILESGEITRIADCSRCSPLDACGRAPLGTPNPLPPLFPLNMKTSWTLLCGDRGTLAHEVGHNLGLVPKEAANHYRGSGPFPEYHSVNSMISTEAFNLHQWENLSEWQALMSHESVIDGDAEFLENSHNNQEVDYPWLVRIRSAWADQGAVVGGSGFMNSASLQQPERDWKGRRLVFLGSVNASGRLQVRSVFPAPAGSYLTPVDLKGPVTVAFLDKQGNTLREDSLPLTMGTLGGSNQKARRFNQLQVLAAARPLPGDTAAIEVRHHGDVVYRRAPGSNPPKLTLFRPELVGEQVAVGWKGTDNDGDEVAYRVEFSRDGIRYVALGSPMRSCELKIPLRNLPGGEAVFRVTATDGLNSVTNVSETISLPDRKPFAAITSFTDGQTFSEHDAIVLRGLAFDMEEGIFGHRAGHVSRFTWIADSRTILGTGSQIVVQRQLKPGEHTITLVAEDSSRQKSSVSKRILIEGDSDKDTIPDWFEREDQNMDPHHPYDATPEKRNLYRDRIKTRKGARIPATFKR